MKTKTQARTKLRVKTKQGFRMVSYPTIAAVVEFPVNTEANETDRRAEEVESVQG